MIIIAGYLLTDPSERDDLVAAHADLMERARRAEGCLDLAISPDQLDPARINNYEAWQDEEVLQKWRSVANAPDMSGRIRGGDMHKYTIASSSDPF